MDKEIPSDAKVGILKLDVQGFELEVLIGGSNTLKNTSIIVLEMNNHDGYLGSPKYYEIDEYLRNNGFVLYDIFPSQKNFGQLTEWDTIYINKSVL